MNHQDRNDMSTFSSVFKRDYADHYDVLYQEKDYESECNMIEEAFRRYSRVPVKRILDLGCGTGNHAIPMARKGYRVTGIDRSQQMLEHARSKLLSIHPPMACPPSFQHGDLRNLKLRKRFDAVLMMFAVLGYQATNADVLAALKSVHRHLPPGGIFIFDVWHGPAVLAIRPGDRIKMIPTEGGRLLRITSGSLDVNHQLVTVHYTLFQHRGKRVVSETSETHRMRFFFPLELELLLEAAGLKLVALRCFGDLDREPDEQSWNTIAVVQR